ncbi:glutamine-hydrolyzing GMP synthase [Ruthenibacterium lactatiformans]|uniref:glutamine-hydrolyzing GMP synthase n=1 Tax=Ruthenibacterium lactatiformans TaxID=1550024 RepID=UPI003AF03812
MKQDMIVILDLGSEENPRLAREIRALGVYSEIYPHDITLAELNALPNVKGIILNGGPNHVVDGVEIDACSDIYGCGLPLLQPGHKDGAPWPTDAAQRKAVLSEFVFDACGAQPNWNMENFIADQVELIRRQVGDKKVLLALSGGVDSSVVAALLIKAIGKQLVCVHVNHGLLRKGEPEQVVEVFRNQMDANLIYVDAVDRFLNKLSGVAEPEQKRKIIGAEFIRVFEEEARKLDGIHFLAQGTIYPDIIESGTKTVKAVKSHHNVGGLPEDLDFALVEPLKMLFKDEVRACGKALGLPDSMVYRQPFPGPGLGVRCLGAITRDRLEAVRESDAILREEFAKAGLEGKVWQYFTVVPDFKSVGVHEGVRTFDWPVILRAVNTVDAMTATVEDVPFALLQKITQRITSEVKGVNRVLYDLTPKPSGTIEWE